MNFYLVECNIMSITRSPLEFPDGYKLCNHGNQFLAINTLVFLYKIT